MRLKGHSISVTIRSTEKTVEVNPRKHQSQEDLVLTFSQIPKNKTKTSFPYSKPDFLYGKEDPKTVNFDGLSHYPPCLEEARLRHPFTAIVAGPTGCGKSIFALKLIKYAKEMIIPAPERIIWCYDIYQDMFDKFNNVVFHEGLPDLSMFDGKQRVLVVIDDLMAETNDKVCNLFTKVSHHKSVSVLYLSQNLFFKNKQNRTLSLNSHYMVLFKNVRDSSQIACLARQMYPGNGKFMLESFKDATSNPFGYLLVDMRPETDELFRLRSNIFPDDQQYVYIPK